MTATGCAPGVWSSLAREQPPAGRLDAEHVEEVAGDDEAAHELRRVAGVKAGGDAAPARQRLERRRMVAQRLVLRIGEDPAGPPVHVDEALAVRHRQALEERGVDQAEHRGVGADAERQRQHGGDRESRLLAQHPCGVAQIVEEPDRRGRRAPAPPAAAAGCAPAAARRIRRASASWPSSSSSASRRASSAEAPSARSCS